MIYIKENQQPAPKSKKETYWPYICTHADIKEFRTITTLRFRHMGKDIFTVSFKIDGIKVIFEGDLEMKEALLNKADKYIASNSDVFLPELLLPNDLIILDEMTEEVMADPFLNLEKAGYERSLLENLKTRILNLEKHTGILNT